MALSNRDCRHGRQIGKCADCDLDHMEMAADAEARRVDELTALRKQVEHGDCSPRRNPFSRDACACQCFKALRVVVESGAATTWKNRAMVWRRHAGLL